MAVAERITEHVQRLPERLQAEVLDLVEYLHEKAERKSATEDEPTWPRISFSLAMRDMEDEEMPQYSATDLKESLS